MRPIICTPVEYFIQHMCKSNQHYTPYPCVPCIASCSTDIHFRGSFARKFCNLLKRAYGLHVNILFTFGLSFMIELTMFGNQKSGLGVKLACVPDSLTSCVDGLRSGEQKPVFKTDEKKR